MLLWLVLLVFFFKQKTAYEMRISDWSSDVCSSDLPALVDVGGGSGTGSLYLNDHRWPDAYNNTPLMADWGRSYLYRHPVAADGPTFMQEEEIGSASCRERVCQSV